MKFLSKVVQAISLSYKCSCNHSFLNKSMFLFICIELSWLYRKDFDIFFISIQRFFDYLKLLFIIFYLFWRSLLFETKKLFHLFVIIFLSKNIVFKTRLSWSLFHYKKATLSLISWLPINFRNLIHRLNILFLIKFF